MIKGRASILAHIVEQSGYCETDTSNGDRLFILAMMKANEMFLPSLLFGNGFFEAGWVMRR
jgi:hypothetical protein